MKLTLSAGALLALALLPAMSHAQRPISLNARTAGDLAQLCGARPGNARADAGINYCHGFAQGAADVFGYRRRKQTVLLPQSRADPHRHARAVRRLGARHAGPRAVAGGQRPGAIPGRTLPLQIAPALPPSRQAS